MLKTPSTLVLLPETYTGLDAPRIMLFLLRILFPAGREPFFSRKLVCRAWHGITRELQAHPIVLILPAGTDEDTGMLYAGMNLECGNATLQLCGGENEPLKYGLSQNQCILYTEDGPVINPKATNLALCRLLD